MEHPEYGILKYNVRCACLRHWKPMQVLLSILGNCYLNWNWTFTLNQLNTLWVHQNKMCVISYSVFSFECNHNLRKRWSPASIMQWRMLALWVNEMVSLQKSITPPAETDPQLSADWRALALTWQGMCWTPAGRPLLPLSTAYWHEIFGCFQKKMNCKVFCIDASKM